MDDNPIGESRATPRNFTLYGYSYGDWRDIGVRMFPTRRAHQDLFSLLHSFAKRSPTGRIDAPTKKILCRYLYTERVYRYVMRDFTLAGIVQPQNVRWWTRQEGRSARDGGRVAPEIEVLLPGSRESLEAASFAFSMLLGAGAAIRLMTQVHQAHADFFVNMQNPLTIDAPPDPVIDHRGNMSELEIRQLVARNALQHTVEAMARKSEQVTDKDHETVGECDPQIMQPLHDNWQRSCNRFMINHETKVANDNKGCELQDSQILLPKYTNPKDNTNPLTLVVANATDGRHHAIESFIKAEHKNRFQITCQWDGSEGRSLKKLLEANPSWSIEQLRTMVSNRFASDGITADRPRMWLSNLGKYIGGPVDRYGKSKSEKDISHVTGQVSTASARNLRNRQTLIESALAYHAQRALCDGGELEN